MAQASTVDEETRKRTRKIISALKKEYPDAECALKHRSPFQLLVATILSAQCTDQRVNVVTPGLFQAYPTPRKMAKAKQKDVEKIIHSLGFFRAKAKSLIGMASGVVEKHGGKIPQNLDDLVDLPGVGRKTANVILGTAFGIPSGVVVDTHVKRISGLALGAGRSDRSRHLERDEPS